ncbi:hypothetical protein [Blastopirellula marina]|nr:hypothetical protein [Blastopirellula marina]
MRFNRIDKSNRWRAWLPLFVVGMMTGFAGCGSEPPNPDGRETVTGSIKLNGTPLIGMAGIKFVPVEGGDGGGQGQIKEGSFVLSGYDGVKPGKYIVQVFATVDFDKSTGKIGDATMQFGNEVTVDIIPPEFNQESKIEFEVVAGGNNVFDYDIQTDFVPKMPKNAQGKGAIPL